MSTIKRLIEPFQRVLMAKRLCPGCTAPLEKAKRFPYDATRDMAICHCRRMFLYDKTMDSYQRATLKEAEMFSKKR